MAITINTSPPSGSSVHDNMWHVFSSDNSGQTDFKFVVDIYVGGVQKVRVKQFPEPGTGKAYFDAGPTVRNEMDYAWFEPTNASAYVAEPDISGQAGIVYDFRVGEDFSGLTTLNMASGQVTGYNWAPPLFGRRSVNLNDKFYKWFTNRPLIARTALAENLFIPLCTPAGETVTLHCNKFDASNNQIGSTLNGSAFVLENGLLQCNIGTTALSATLSTTFDESVKYYDVWFNNYKSIRVYPVCNPKFTPIPIHFVNRWGMWETHRFDLLNKLNMNVERKDFGQRDYRFNGNAVDYLSTANRYYEGKINYSNKANWTYKLNSTPLSDDEYTWLAELFTSPQIYLEYGSLHYPVTIRKNTYEYNQYVSDRLKAFDVEFEFNSSRITQLR